MKIADPQGRDKCVQLLRVHTSTLDNCFQEAWKRWLAWLSTLAGSPADITPRSRANILYDMIKAEAIERFAGTPGVTAREERRFLVLYFGDTVALRFKKFRSKTLRVSQNRTRQATAYGQQELEYSSTLEPLTHLVAGYLLDDLELNLERLAITCSMGGQHLWLPIDILDGKASSITVPRAPQSESKKPTVHSTARVKRPTTGEKE